MSINIFKAVEEIMKSNASIVILGFLMLFIFNICSSISVYLFPLISLFHNNNPVL